MTQQKITFADKTNLTPFVDRPRQICAEDLNEIKTKFNNNIDELEYLLGILPEWYGAVADGVTDSTTAIEEADTYANSINRHLVFAGGSYVFNGTTINSKCLFSGGSIISTGTLTFTNEIVSPRYHIFTGVAATSDIVCSNTPHIYPEWFDVKPGVSEKSLNKYEENKRMMRCVQDSKGHLVFGAGTYYMRDLLIDGSDITISGQGSATILQNAVTQWGISTRLGVFISAFGPTYFSGGSPVISPLVGNRPWTVTSQQSNVILRDFDVVWDDSELAVPDPTMNGLAIDNYKNVLIENVKVDMRGHKSALAAVVSHLNQKTEDIVFRKCSGINCVTGMYVSEGYTDEAGLVISGILVEDCYFSMLDIPSFFSNTGAINSGSNILTLAEDAASVGIFAGMSIKIDGAGVAGGAMYSVPLAVDGFEVTLSTNASTTVTGAAVSPFSPSCGLYHHGTSLAANMDQAGIIIFRNNYINGGAVGILEGAATATSAQRCVLFAENNYLYNNTEQAILTYAKNSEFRGNVIDTTVLNSTLWEAAGVLISKVNNIGGERVIVENNIFKNCSGTGIDGYAYGIYIKSVAGANYIIRGNRFIYESGTTAYFDVNYFGGTTDISEVLLDGNIFYERDAAAANVYGSVTFATLLNEDPAVVGTYYNHYALFIDKGTNFNLKYYFNIHKWCRPEPPNDNRHYHIGDVIMADGFSGVDANWFRCVVEGTPGTWVADVHKAIKTKVVTLTLTNPCKIGYDMGSLPNGAKCTFTTDGTLPAAIVSGTEYFMRKVDSTYCTLYDTYAHAVAGGATGLVETDGDTQTGVHTIYIVIPASIYSDSIVFNSSVLAADLVIPAISAMKVGHTFDILNSVTGKTHTITLPAGATWDGTNDVATFDTSGQALVCKILSTTRILVLSNVGTVVFS